MGSRNVVDYTLESFGWKTYLQQRRGTSKITLNKIIVVGCGLQKGQPLFCYLGRDREDRQIIMAYLDGKPRTPREEGGNMYEKKKTVQKTQEKVKNGGASNGKG